MKAFVLMGIVSFSAISSSPIPSVELDDKSAQALGFVLDISSDKYAKMIELKGPSIIGEDCTPLASGSFVIDIDGNEKSGFINSTHPEKPESLGFVDVKNLVKLIVFIDYQCKSKATRYEVSIDNRPQT
jgi:hypothetical protein